MSSSLPNGARVPDQRGWYTLPWFSYSAVAFSLIFLLIGVESLSALPGLGALAYSEQLLVISYLLCLLLATVGFLAWINAKLTGRKVESRRRSWVIPTLAANIVIGILLTMVSLVVPAVQDARRAAAATKDWQTVPIPGSNIGLDMPKGYAPNEAFEIGPSGLGYSNIPGTRSIIAMAVPKVDLVTGSLQEYADLVGQSFHESVQGSTQMDITVTDRAGQPCIRQTYEYAESGMRFLAILEYQEVGSFNVQVRYLTTPSQFESWVAEIDKVSESIREVSND